MQLNVRGYKERLTCYVADITTDFDIILGQDWIKGHDGVLDYRVFQLRFRRKCASGPQAVTWHCFDETHMPTGTPEPVLRDSEEADLLDSKEPGLLNCKKMVLNALQLQRVLRKGCEKLFHV